MNNKFKNSISCASKDVLIFADYNTKPPLLAFRGFFYVIAAQKWLPHGLIQSNPKQKASGLFTTQPHERGNDPTCQPCPSAQSMKDSGNIDAAKWCK